MAGKTGTSEKIDEWNAAGRKGEKKYIASYCGYAPAEDPGNCPCWYFLMSLCRRMARCSAAPSPVRPLRKPCLKFCPYLGIEPKYTEEELAKLDISTPGVVGLSQEEAQTKVSNAGLTYKVYGSGDKVVSPRSPEQGKSIPKGGTVVLYLDSASASETVTVPDLSGLTLSQVNTKVSQAGLNLSVSGAAVTGGNAVSDTQDIAAGTEVPCRNGGYGEFCGSGSGPLTAEPAAN